MTAWTASSTPTATSRRGYSPKATFNHAYDDVIQIVGQTHMTMTPTVFGGMRDLLAAHPELKNDPRLALDPPWLRHEIKNFNNVIGSFLPAKDTGTGKAVMDMLQGGRTHHRGHRRAGRHVPARRIVLLCPVRHDAV